MIGRGGETRAEMVVRDETEEEEGRRGVVGDGARVFSGVVLAGRRAAREAGCYGLFSPGVGTAWTRCALPSAPEPP